MSIYIICLFIPVLTKADIYIYQDENGVMHFTNTPMHQGYRLYIKEKNDFRVHLDVNDDLIKRIAIKYDLPPALLKAVIKVESDFNPDVVSESGAIGLMQLKPATAREMGVTNPFSPQENIEGGARYLKILLNQFQGNLPRALGAYFVGPNAILQKEEDTRVKAYVNRVLRYFEYYRQHFQ
ncbi:MAG: lytic transglycosylase domain-containing protein [Candidatus Desulfofervidaceae bacterium]|nr:lytic transglycosylase domain-containing protein [Candidatus Desulfofervidaceae bacterium]